MEANYMYLHTPGQTSYIGKNSHQLGSIPVADLKLIVNQARELQFKKKKPFFFYFERLFIALFLEFIYESVNNFPAQ